MFFQSTWGIEASVEILKWSQDVLTKTGELSLFRILINKTHSANMRETAHMYRNRLIDLDPPRNSRITIHPDT